MAEKTPIEWCDSAVNPVMGCDGCELWNPAQGVQHCYAGQLHKIRAGRPGYADRFEEPKRFPGRLSRAARWSDLAGRERPDKPWLGTAPRHIFISDMGDALSRSVSFDFLLEEIICAVKSPEGSRHRWLWLTKRPERMRQFASWLRDRGILWPQNLWAGTSVTSSQHLKRIRHLLQVPAAGHFVSCEPLLSRLDIARYLKHEFGFPQSDGSTHYHTQAEFMECRSKDCKHSAKVLHRPALSWVIAGGESGKDARPCAVEWLAELAEDCAAAKVPFFCKQLGATAVSEQRRMDGKWAWVQGLQSAKGNSTDDLPRELHIREVPGHSVFEWTAAGVKVRHKGEDASDDIPF